MTRPRAGIVSSLAVAIGILGPAASDLWAACTPQIDEQATHWFEGVVEQGLDTVTIYVQAVDADGQPLGDNSDIPDEFLAALEAAINQWKGEDESGQTSGTCSGSANVPKFQFQIGSRDSAPVPPAVEDARQSGIQLSYFGSTSPPPSDEESTLALADHDSGSNAIRVFGRCPFEAGIPCNAAGNIDWVNPERYGEKVLTHEIGHSLGFGHDTCAQSIMRAQVDLSELGGVVLVEHCSEADEINGRGKYRATAEFLGVGAGSWVVLSINGNDLKGGSIGDAVSGRGSGTFTGFAEWPEGSTVTSYAVDAPTNPDLQCTASGHSGTVTGDFHYTVSCTCTNCQSSVLGEDVLGFRCGGETCDVAEDPVKQLRNHCTIVSATCYSDAWGKIRLPHLTTYCYRVTESYFTNMEITTEDGTTVVTEVLTIIETTSCKDGYVVHSTPLPDGGSTVDPRSEAMPGGMGPITAVIEPLAGEVQSGVIEVTGIARDDVYGTGQVALWIDNEPAPVQNLTWGQSFPAGCVDLPGAPASSCNPNMGWSGTLDTRLLTNGTHKLQVVAVSGRTGTWPPLTYAEKTLEVYNCPDTTPPSVSLDSPPAGSDVTGTVQVTATATDDVGVTRVRLFVDGAPVANDWAAPWGFTWNSATVPNGDHELRLKAFDACGNRDTSLRTTVSVWNPIPGGPHIRVLQSWDGMDVTKGSSVDFGSVAPGVATSRVFTIRNEGDQALTLSNPSSLVTGSCFSQIDADPPETIPSGGETSFRVRLMCSAPGNHTGTISISSNEPDDNPFNFTVRGMVTAPEIRVVKAWDGAVMPLGGTFWFPEINAGSSDSRYFEIHNDGTSRLEILNPSSLVTGACFQQSENAAALVDPGGSTGFRVRFFCNQGGTHTGTVSISHNGSSADPYTFTVKGTMVVPQPEISVSLTVGGSAVALGSTVQFPSTQVNIATSLRFSLHNTGDADLNLSNASTLVSGTCFWQVETPLASIPPGGTGYLRVRLNCSSGGTYTGTVSIGNDDPDENPYWFQVRGTVLEPPPDVRVSRAWDGVTVASGSTFPFPSIQVGQPASRLFAIQNDGTGSLYLDAPGGLVSGTCFNQVETPVNPIPPGGAGYVRVRLFCNNPGTFTGTVSIGSNDPDEDPYWFQVTGTVEGPPPDISVTQVWNGVTVANGATFQFPPSAAGTAASRQFAIHNTGSGPLNLSNASSLVSGTCFGQVETPTSSIPVGGTGYVRVRFLCSQPGTYAGMVAIYSNDPDENPYSFTVTGTKQ